MPIEPPDILLLDTHIWVEVVEGVSRAIGRKTQDRIAAASARGQLRLSPISVWEVAMLHAKGRLQCLPTIDEWVDANMRAPGLQLSELTPSILIESTRLSKLAHGDPADRILIATAQSLGATLLTRDREILRYARRGHLVALNAMR